ncbi:DUF2723 domain-containing protein [Mucilaginibacter sp. RS28]|uniref:DUF2723 domain-containing protein n=1 Tax=Mucilaginibacter straminoryzae TaxID=2932774 RepID=A0A9X1X7M5_9SPHI|nr:DUF2723 domain-containing protein [Mucilaginibacter straminoryzae]MCJ8211645.1 DUF2723 domain-containing protein [Mucilaginibacter straminoryzae]
MNYNKTNNLFGWITFVIAAITYILTLEPSASFWDCGEFIACIYRLQVAHQPGAPLFTMIGKIFSLLSFGDVHKVAYWTNMASALASAATILFLFWSITALAKKLLVKNNNEISATDQILIIGAGIVGALAYTWSDTFWFSAVESEVYAQSSLCTAIVFWATLKWDAHADEPGADRWLIFIAYIMGLSIGIHLLNLLVIPAIALVIYFRRAKTITSKGTIWSFILGCVALGLVLWGIIQYTVKGAAYSDLFFVNTLGFSFNTGAIIFYLLLVAAIVLGIYYTIKPNNSVIIAAAACFILLLFFSAGIIGVIAGAAVLAILEYILHVRKARYILNIVLLGAFFILLGYSSFVMIIIRAKAGTNLNNSDPEDAFALNSYLNRDQYGETPLLYGQYFDAKQTDVKEGQTLYRRGKTKYEIAGKKQTAIYDHNTPFPRIFSQTGDDVQFYRQWLHLGQEESPTMAHNIGFFLSWQVNQMYNRYFLWNFVGRTNDMDGQNDSNGTDGNWITGFNAGKRLPYAVTHSKSYNRMYALPFLIGVLGLVYHFRRRQRDAGIVAVLFFFTGLAIVLYLNQDPNQPRERDYAYAGSFYAFAIWIGLGVLAIADLLSKKMNAKTSALIASVACLIAAPILMASQEWDDHDRSTKTTPRDMATNYLQSCAPNAILFTYGDNDTYPLWYAQEVEGIRPDVRIVNLSLLGTDWYIRQMKQKMNTSAPLPITMPNEKFVAGVRDVLYLNDRNLPGSIELKEVFDFVTSDSQDAKIQYENGESDNYLPTQNFKITNNPDEVVSTGTVPAQLKDKIDPVMSWKYPSRYLTKDNLAMIDILAHNNWKRPVYFAITVGNDNMIGLDKYLYNEGFAYRLMPLKPDTAAQPLEVTNTLTMYNNMMNKFKWGNMKHARYLDHESTVMFYPLIMKQFSTLSDHLVAEGHTDLAKNLLKRFDEVMPDLYPYTEVSARKFYMVESGYKAGEPQLANKWANELDTYLDAVLSYNSDLLKDNADGVNTHDVQLCMSILNGLVGLTKDNQQTALSAKLDKQFKDYESKLSSILARQQQ